MVDMRRNPGDRLNSWALTVTTGFAGMFRLMTGLIFFFLSVAMVVLGKGIQRSHVLGVFYISLYTLNT